MWTIWDVLESNYGFWAIPLTTFICLEYFFPRFPKQKMWRQESAQDVGFLFVSEFLNSALARLMAYYLLSLTNLGPYVARHFPAVNAFAAWPLWAQFAFLVVVSDFLSWHLHYGLHRSKFLFRFHTLHHSSEKLDWLATFRSHWLDTGVIDLSSTIPLAILPASPHAAVTFTLWGLFLTLFLHSNNRVGMLFDRPTARKYFWWLITPTAHYWHHSAISHRKYGQNFGFFSTFYDRLYGSFYLPPNSEAPERFGLYNQQNYSRDFFKRFFGPLLPGRIDRLKTVSGMSRTTNMIRRQKTGT